MPAPESLLVALDFSYHSEAALTAAFELADKFDAKVHLIHVFTLQDTRESIAFSDTDLHDTQRDARHKLEASAEAHRPAGHVGEVLWREGDPAAEIVIVARELHVDLIALGASGRTGMTRLRLGSVAEHVVSDAPCSVFVVRAPGH